MRALLRLFPSWHGAAVAAATVVALLAALVALPLVDDESESAPGDESGAEVDVSAGERRPAEQDDAEVATSVTAGDAPAGDTGGSDEASGGSAAPGSGGEGAGPAPVTDRGTVKVGIMLLNVGNVERLGVAVGVNPEQQRRAWDAYVARVNEQGGINGRRIAPVYRQYDVTSNDSMRAACLAMTEDEKVFAVLDIALTTANALCVADEHDTPLVTLQPMPREAYDRSEGRLVTLFAEGSRMWRNVAIDLHERGLLRGKTIGILGDTAPGNPPTLDALEAELDRLGYKVAHRSRFASDGTTAQLPQASSQVPVEVQAMRRANVDLILMATGNIISTQFVQSADRQGYRPAYYATDWFNGYSDTYVQNMPDEFNGTLITTNRTGEFRVNLPEPDRERECREEYERRTGGKLDRTTIEYNSTVRLCTILDVFVRGAILAGDELSAATLSRGVQSIGELPLATFGGGSYREGKFDGADLIRSARFDGGCNCWVPADQFRRPALT